MIYNRLAAVFGTGTVWVCDESGLTRAFPREDWAVLVAVVRAGQLR